MSRKITLMSTLQVLIYKNKTIIIHISPTISKLRSKITPSTLTLIKYHSITLIPILIVIKPIIISLDR